MLSAKSRILTPTTLNLVKRCLPKPMPHIQKPTVEDFKTEEEFQVINYIGPPGSLYSYVKSNAPQKDIKSPIGANQSGSVIAYDQKRGA